jgi:hypothetical protein
MAKLILLSAIIMGIFIPVWAARDPNPERGFKRTLVFYTAFCFCYVLALKYLYFRLVS